MEEDPVIITNGFVLCCDPTNRSGRFHLVVRDGRIQEIGGTLEFLTAMYPRATVIDATDKLIIPGFVNAHYHTLSFLLEELTSGKPFSGWKSNQVLKEQLQSFTEPGSGGRLGVVARAAFLAHLKSGTTSIGQFPPPVGANGFDVLLAAGETTGVRTVTMLQSWDQIARAREEKSPQQRFMISLGREEDYTVYSFENFVRSAKELGCSLVAHAGEQRDEAELVRKIFSKSLCTLFRDFGALQPSTLLVHLNHGGKEDLEVMAHSGPSLVLCPISALRKQTGYPFLRLLAGRSVRICLGTDWGSTDMFAEMRFVQNLPKLFAGMPAFSAIDIIRMVTINGAAALGLDAEVGSIETGKRADLAFLSLLDVRTLAPREAWSTEGFAALTVESMSPMHVIDVMVGGHFLVRSGHAVKLNEQELVNELNAVRELLPPADDQRQGKPSGAPPAGTTVVRPKTFAFATGERTQNAEDEVYVEGFSVVKNTDTMKEVEEVKAPAPEPSRPPSQTTTPPELSKNVKKVFGENDDF